MAIHRVAMSKVKDRSKIPKLLKSRAVRVSLNPSPNPPSKLIHPSPVTSNGKTYILIISAGGTGLDSRSQGWNFAVKSQYATKEDMDFYDNDSEAQVEPKKVARPLVEGVKTAWWDSEGAVEFSRL